MSKSCVEKVKVTLFCPSSVFHEDDGRVHRVNRVPFRGHFNKLNARLDR